MRDHLLHLAVDLLAAPDPGAPPHNPLEPIINRATGWLLGILLAIATFFATVGLVRYVSAGGDPQQVESAKKSFKHSFVGYGLAILVPTIFEIVEYILGA
jgi:hypothetical protein